jgi:hypothetical protein
MKSLRRSAYWLGKRSGSVRRISRFQLLKRLGGALLILAIGFISGTGVSHGYLFAQTSDKRIETPKSLLKPLVKIKEARIGNQLVAFNEGFAADPDWLSHTTVKIENVSGKSIVYLTLNLDFPESAATGYPMVFPFHLGKRPGATVQTSDAALDFTPGQILDIDLSSKYTLIENFLAKRQPIDSFHKMVIQIGFIVFDDGTAWQFGSFMKPDPQDPSRYIPIPQPEKDRP